MQNLSSISSFEVDLIGELEGPKDGEPDGEPDG